MTDVVIPEFMDAYAVDSLRADFDVHYDPGLHADATGISTFLGQARALIVRNRTRVDARLLAAGPRRVAVGRRGGAWTTSIWMYAPRATCRSIRRPVRTSSQSRSTWSRPCW